MTFLPIRLILTKGRVLSMIIDLQKNHRCQIMTSQDTATLEQQAAAALHVELLPGTEIMREVGNAHFTHARGSNVMLVASHSYEHFV